MCDCWADLHVAECSQCTRTRLEAEEFVKFGQSMRQTLPQELVDMVEDWVYEMTFWAGRLYPGGTNRKTTTMGQQSQRQRSQPNGGRCMLLAFSKRILNTYRPRMCTESTWVIAPGPCKDSLAFLSEPNFALAKGHVRRVHLSLSIRDLDTDGWVRSRPKYKLFRRVTKYWDMYDRSPEKAAKLTFPDSSIESANTVDPYKRWLLANTERYRQLILAKHGIHGLRHWLHMTVMDRLLKEWEKKVVAICQLNIEELTLDLIGCYDLGGFWLGMGLVVALQSHGVRFPQAGLTVRVAEWRSYELTYLKRHLLSGPQYA
ncbi:MAG: hypothetical protein Q9169_006346 [Polycauliona sp. 2 TL-2023]